MKGWGKGGQGVNKSSNAVVLTHDPTATVVKVHAHRALSDNRKEARQLLRDRLDVLLNGAQSKTELAKERIRKAKQGAARRSRKKYDPESPASGPPGPDVAEAAEGAPRSRLSRAERAKQALSR